MAAWRSRAALANAGSDMAAMASTPAVTSFKPFRLNMAFPSVNRRFPNFTILLCASSMVYEALRSRISVGTSMNLHTAGHRRGVVCAPHAATVEDGRHILAEGGNAIEAMIAMAASIAAVYPHMNHVGGDGFWLIRQPSGRVHALMGAGRAGAKATPRLFRDAGHHEIPTRGPLAALTVPGAVSTWLLASEAAKTQVGKGTRAKLPLDVLLAPAIKHAREGYAVTRSQARLTVEKYAELETAPGFMQAFLVDRKAPKAGARLKQAAFAATLEQLVQAGLDLSLI